MIQLIVIRLRFIIMVSYISVVITDEQLAISIETPRAFLMQLRKGTRFRMVMGHGYILINLTAESLYS